MASILQGTITWTGWSGAPGYTVLYTRLDGIITTAVDNTVGALDHLADQLHFLVPNGVTLSASKEVKQLTDSSGVLEAMYTSPVATPSWVGSGGATFSAPSGACISWGTDDVNRGRRIRGRSFIVPLAAAMYQADGSLTDACLASLNDAADDWHSSGGYAAVVWSRPRLGTGGLAADITSHHITDQAAVLRSRRD